MKSLAILIFPLFVLFSCSGQESRETVKKHKVSDNCKALNDSAVSNIQKYYETLDKEELIKAIALLEKAIICDSSYFMAMSNLSTAYSLQGNYRQSINILDQLLTITKNDLEILVHKGSLLEILGDRDSAESIYLQVNNRYQEKMKERPNDIQLTSNYIFFLAIYKGKEAAQSFLNKQMVLYPNKDLENLKFAIDNFDKQEYLMSISVLK